MKNHQVRNKIIYVLVFPFFIYGCFYEDQIKLRFDKANLSIVNITNSIIVELEVVKTSKDSNFICSKTFKLQSQKFGLREISLKDANENYKNSDSSCLFQKGFLYKIKGRSLHSSCTLFIDY